MYVCTAHETHYYPMNLNMNGPMFPVDIMFWDEKMNLQKVNVRKLTSSIDKNILKEE